MAPTRENCELYEEWTAAATASKKDAFFADEVKSCQRLIVEPGHLLVIPAGTQLGFFPVPLSSVHSD